jgi:hypothetical protein
MRPTACDFPDDPACAHLDRQYMLGDNLLVAPVSSADGDTSFYVPAGGWTDLRTGEVFSGPGWFRRRYGFGDLPLLVRPGSVIPFGACDDGPEYPYAEGVTLRVYQPRHGQRITVAVPEPTGATAAMFTVVRDWSTVIVERGSRGAGRAAGAVAGLSRRWARRGHGDGWPDGPRRRRSTGRDGRRGAAVCHPTGEHVYRAVSSAGNSTLLCP